MKKIIALLLSVVMLLGVTTVAAEEGIPYPADYDSVKTKLSASEISEKVSPSVFYIEVYDENVRAIGSGSGFFVSSDGVAVTNYHVIEGTAGAQITTINGEKFDVSNIIAFDEELDVAIIRVNKTSINGNFFSEFPSVAMANSDEIKAGQTVYALGSPVGLQNTISNGIISNVKQDVGEDTFIQITAPISHGSSGGALVNEYGEVLGITSAGIEDAQNIGFAIPINVMELFNLNEVGMSYHEFSSTDNNFTLEVYPDTIELEVGIPYPADIEGHWAEGEIARAYMSGMVNGDPDGSFRPDDSVSRAEFLKMLVAIFCERLEGFVPDELDDGTHWASKYYNFANVMMFAPLDEASAVDGIVPGLMSAENFDLPIGRWEMSYLVSASMRNVLGIEGRAADKTYTDAEEIKAGFSADVAESINNTFLLGIMTGDEQGNINAKQGGTRAEAVVIVNRVDAILIELIKQAEATQQQQQQLEQQIAESVKVYEVIPEGHPVVTFEMKNGKKFKVELYPEYAPQTVANFVELAKSGFYNGLTFHRVVEGFMAQGGDPEGNGTGGSEHNIKGEFAANGFEGNTLSHTRGVISMARSGHPDSASSQFFICYDDASFLDGSYAAFGKVIEGMEVVDDFLKVERTQNEMGELAKPVEPVVIKTVTVGKGK